MSAAELPPAVRARVLALASQRLASLAEQSVPAAVRPFRHFAPSKRARLAAPALAASLEADPAFRQSVAESVDPTLVSALRAGQDLPAAAPEDLGAALYLLRPDGWPAVLQQVADVLAERDRQRSDATTVDAVERLTEQLAEVRSAARVQALELTEQGDGLRRELAVALRSARQLGARAALAERRLAEVEQAAASTPSSSEPMSSTPSSSSPSSSNPPAPDADDHSVRAAPDAAAGVDPGSVRRLRARLRTAEHALATARTEGRTHARADRHGDQVRLRVLLDALLGAGAGLRRELALPALAERPADGLADRWSGEQGVPAVPVQGRTDDDPARLDALLAAPAGHLLVDGYNVTMTGYGEQTLEVQRGRLLAGLGALAARTGAETTVVFDGASVPGVRLAPPRGVRVLFSRPGETADDVLRTLVAAEPRGRPLVVVSSDRAVADDVRRAGATPVPSRALIALLER